MNNIDALVKLIHDSNNIVFFGGAGVSVESNIPDFRSANGLYNDKKYISVESILSGTFFYKHPDKFYEFYKDKMIYLDAKPNDCHLALARLEEMGKVRAVITQNIDNLHTLAGSKEVLELHGSVYRNHCLSCHKSFSAEYVVKVDGVPKCDKCGGIIKPDVVLYEESLDMDTLERAINYISNADVLIIGGTSLSVYPAAGLIRYYSGNKLVIINKSITQYDTKADLVINESIGKVFNEVMKRIGDE